MRIFVLQNWILVSTFKQDRRTEEKCISSAHILTLEVVMLFYEDILFIIYSFLYTVISLHPYFQQLKAIYNNIIMVKIE